MVKVKEDLTGFKQPNGRLTVIKQVEDYVSPQDKHESQWECLCDCGNKEPVILRGTDIKHERIKSCGCLQKEKIRQKCKKYNKYDLSGEYGVGWTTNTNQEFYFDLEDYDQIKNYCWTESISKTGYHSLVTRDANTNKVIRMNWIIVGKDHDHIDRNPLNNRKNNLRKATQQENSINRSLQNNNTSGFVGVWFHKQNMNWIAEIKLNGSKIRLGSFNNKRDAVCARLNAELKYFGLEFAPQRHLFEEYGIKDGELND